jgi:hypothetical protein
MNRFVESKLLVVKKDKCKTQARICSSAAWLTVNESPLDPACQDGMPVLSD